MSVAFKQTSEGRFSYLLEKIRVARFSTEPFRHIYIENFLSESDFREIIQTPEILLPEMKSDKQLIAKLIDELHYEPIEFPGAITNPFFYRLWHKRKRKNFFTHSACEGFGLVLRLAQTTSPAITALSSFLLSHELNQVLAEKAGVSLDNVVVDSGIQKYLDGYEISPHPDIRKKALTFMVNINPHPESDKMDHHTHYLRLKPEYRYVKDFWTGNPLIDRCWIPWDWCETVKMQTQNNSLVLFCPANDTLHAVRANYNHLTGQRTQLYGNLWHKDNLCRYSTQWEALDLPGRANTHQNGMARLRLQQWLSRMGRLLTKHTVGKRNI